MMTKKNKNKNKAVKRAAALAFNSTKMPNPVAGSEFCMESSIYDLCMYFGDV